MVKKRNKVKYDKTFTKNFSLANIKMYLLEVYLKLNKHEKLSNGGTLVYV